MKYYYREHLAGYQQIVAEGKTAWGEIHGCAGEDGRASQSSLP